MNTVSPIELAEREIQRDKDDLKRLRKRYPGYDFVRMDLVRNETSTNNPSRQSGDLNDLDIAVLDVVNGGEENEWTSRSVVEMLRGKGIRLPEKDDAAMNAVGYSLIHLKETERIARVHEGRGRDPHRYVARYIEKEVASEEGTS